MKSLLNFAINAQSPLIKTILEIEKKKVVDANAAAKMITPEIIEELVNKVVEKRIEEMITAHPNVSKEVKAIAVMNIKNKK